MLVKQKNNYGFSLLETIISIAILAFVSLTLYTLFSFVLQVIWESKARVGASVLANQKLEMAHNLSYNDVGTTTGMPSGSIPSVEAISLNGVNYTVNTSVRYVDDPFDGMAGGTPDDTLANDYKQIKVAVSWPTKLTHVPEIFLSDIVPNGIESNVGGGTFFIKVYDSAGLSIPQANVNIYNNSLSPLVNMDNLTDNQGLLRLPGAPESSQQYQITVTKAGYSTAQTYPVSAQNPSPDPIHLTIFEGQVTSQSFFIDLLSSINVYVKDEGGLDLADIPVLVRGQKVIGTSGPIYKYDQVSETNNSGEIILTNMEWDLYSFTVATSTGWNIADSDPFQPLNLAPNTTTAITLALEARDEHCLRVVVKNVESVPVVGATVHLYNGTFNETLTTATSGQVFFTPWNQASTTLEVTKSGYEDYSDEFVVSGYMVEGINMVLAP